MNGVPLEDQVWSSAKCAEYLDISKTHFLNCVRYADGFPAPLPIPPYRIGDREVRMDPRWNARAVADWANCRPQELRKAAANA